MRAFVVAALAVSLSGAACNKNSPATTTAPTTTVATPTTTENFAGTLDVGGSTFYSFTVSAASGTVNLTLLSVIGTGVPPTVMLSVGIGTPSDTGCAASTTVMTRSGTTAQLTGTYNAGVYCARVADVGNLFAPAAFSLDIAHP